MQVLDSRFHGNDIVGGFFKQLKYYDFSNDGHPSFPYPYGDIRTDFSTDCAAGASPVIFPDHEEVSLPIDLFSHPNQFLRARDRAEPTALTALAINFDFGHQL